jgi:hypothetical protein
MVDKPRARVMVVGSVPAAQIYDAMLRASGYETRLFTCASEIRIERSETGGWQETCPQPCLCTHAGDILEMALAFRPHLLILNYEVDTPEFLEMVEQGLKEGKRPKVLLITPTDVWCENVDARITSPVDPEVLAQTVESLL